MKQYDKGGRDDPHGHVAFYTGTGKMISSSSTKVGRFSLDKKYFGIKGKPVERFLRYNRENQ